MGTSLVRALRAVLRFLNIIIRFVFGQDAVQLRDRIHAYLQTHWREILRGGFVYIGTSITLPIISFILAFILGGICALDHIAHAVVAVGFLISSLAWILLVFGMAGFLKLVSLMTTPFAVFEETVDLRYNPENVTRFFKRGFSIITWVVVATLYCSIIPVWNSVTGFIILIIITLFLIVSVLGGWVTPDPRLYQKIWKIVFVLFIITTLRFLPDTFWVKMTGHTPPQWFGFHYTETQKTIQKAEKLIAKAKDHIANDKLTPTVLALEDSLKNRATSKNLKTLIDSVKTAMDSVKSDRNQETFPTMIWNAGKNGAKEIRKGIEEIKESLKSEPDTVLVSQDQIDAPPPLIYQNDSLPLNGNWYTLPTVPQNAYKYIFEGLGDVKLGWQYKNFPETSQTLNNLNGYSEMKTWGDNSHSVKAQVRVVSGQAIIIKHTVYYIGG